MKWLLRRITQEQVALNARQLQDVRTRIAEMEGQHRWGTLMNLAPGMAAIVAMQFWPWLRRILPLPWYVAFEIVFVLLVCALTYWILVRRYERFAWRAIRDLGLADVCPRCGYDFTGLPADRRRCPECGAGRDTFVPARATSAEPSS